MSNDIIINNKGILPRLIGGLGNQLFMVASCYTISKIKNCPLYILQSSYNTHNKNNINYSDTIFKYIGTNIEQYSTYEYLNTLYSLGYKYYVQPNSFKVWDPKTIDPGTVTECYFQYYPPISLYENEIRDLLIKGIVEYRDMLNEYHDFDNCVFLHIRRGDYFNYLELFYILDIDYYKKAVDIMLEKNKNIKRIYVVSDDIEWVKNQEFFKQDIFYIYEQSNELITISLMSLCTSGAICAGSTFSWWGAFLGAHSSKNTVIVPKKWIKMQIYDLFPKEWIILDT
jgi:hypothetical protein